MNWLVFEIFLNLLNPFALETVHRLDMFTSRVQS